MGLFRRNKPVAVTASSGFVEPLGRHKASPKWSETLRTADREGPGFVGSWLSKRSRYVSQGEIAFMVNHNNQLQDMTTVKDHEIESRVPLVSAIWDHFHTVDGSVSDFLYKLTRFLSRDGEAYVVLSPSGNGFYVLQNGALNQYQNQYQSYFSFLSDNGGEIMVGPQNVKRFWMEDPLDPLAGWSDAARGVGDIHRYNRTVEALMHDINSHSREDIIAAKGLDYEATPETVTQMGDLYADSSAYTRFIIDLRKNFRRKQIRSYMDMLEQSQGHAPLVAQVEESPTLVSFTRQIDQALFEAEASAIKSFARSVSWPPELLNAGEGTGKYDNDKQMVSSAIRNDVMPFADWLVNKVWNTYGAKVLVKHQIPFRVTLSVDLSKFLPVGEETDSLIKAYNVGAGSRQDVAKSANTTPLDIGDMTETEWWEHVQTVGKTQRDYVPVRSSHSVPSEIISTKPLQVTAANKKKGRTGKQILRELVQGEKQARSYLAGVTAGIATKYQADLHREILKKIPSQSELRKKYQGDPAAMLPKALKDPGVKAFIADYEMDFPQRDSFRLEKAIESTSRFNPPDVEPRNPFPVSLIASAIVTHVIANAYSNWTTEQLDARVSDAVVRELGPGEGLLLDSQSITSAAKGEQIAFQWVHGWFGEPASPYPPHQDLDGVIIASAFDSEAELGFQPSDHDGCTCALIPEVIEGQSELDF